MQHDPDVGLMDAHDVVRNLGSACFAEDGFDFWILSDDSFNARCHRNRILKRRAGESHCFDQQITFLEARHELATKL